jgi:membrane protease YdiL (CAAX protease family)
MLRIFNFPLMKIIIGIILVNIPVFLLRSTAQLVMSLLSVNNETVVTIVIFLVRLMTVYFAYIFFIKILERRKVDELSFDISAIKEFSYGGLIALISITSVMGIMWLLGNYTIYEINHSATLFESFLHNFFFAFLQDVVYFLIIFRIIEKSLGSWIAIVLASIIFGFKHLLFPGYTVWSAIAQVFEAGILFSAFFILTRRIWLLFGFHFIWNFIEYGFILGFKPEGLIELFTSEFSGSFLITGMPVGPEASILTLTIGTGLGLFFIFQAYKKNKLILPFWKIKLGG